MKSTRILIGITGGIAAYKSAALVSQLVQANFSVTVAMTAAATHFVGPATFRALTGRNVAIDMFDPHYPLGAHMELAQSHDLLCIAPASADFLAKMAQGLADDLLATLYLAFPHTVLVAPAMNDRMWSHPATQRNVQQVTLDGVRIIPPTAGWLSCRQSGTGRMADPEAIFAAILSALPSQPA